ncbi:MAG: ATP-binding protein [Spirochaetes bacterium]|nr:ATP-binding protein [Spirochaetota bacterium]
MNNLNLQDTMNKRILIVDDNRDFTDSLVEIFEQRKYAIAFAYDAENGIKINNSFNAQVALIDIRLGKVSGIDLVAELKKIHPDIICIIMTAYVSTETVIEAMQQGAYDYLCKPFNTYDLLATIDRCFDKVYLENEKIKLQAQLLQSHKLETIGSLAGGIAHDFNNILTSIANNAEIVKDDVPNDSTAQECLNDILDVCRNAKNIINQILTFGRQMESVHKPIILYDLIKDVLKLTKSIMPGNISIKECIDVRLIKITGDPARIFQVILNLFTNACQAMEEKGGTIEIGLQEKVFNSETVIENTTIPKGKYAVFNVRDSGVGIGTESLIHIFDPFYTTKQTGKGTGLGLSVANGIVKDHNGYIIAASEIGKGTTFTVYLPSLN